MHSLRHWLSLVELCEDVTDSPEFKAWFAGSKVTKNGRPLKMFHGTNQSFQAFHSGSHFGTSRAANTRLGFLQGEHRRLGNTPPENQHIIPVYLAIKNPLRVSDRDASDEAGLLNSLIRGNYPTSNIDIGLARREGSYVAAERAGYDGLMYRNNIEDRGKYSWVVFHPEQVRSALIEAALHEKVRMASIHGGRHELPVYENPSQTQVRNLLAATEWHELRMLLDHDGHLFVWDAALAHHLLIGSGLGISAQYAGFIDKRGITLRVEPERLPAVRRELQGVPTIIHALGADVPVNLR